MRVLQLLTLGLFGLFAILTAYFQLRSGMKDGEAARSGDPSGAKQAGEHFSHAAGRCAIAAAVMLIVCMVCGALSR